MPGCAVKCCSNYFGKKLKDPDITFHKFPTDPVICDRWAAIVRGTRNESWWKPTPKTYVCSAHFCEQDIYITKGGLHKIRSGAVPKKALYLIPSSFCIGDEKVHHNTDVDLPPDVEIKEDKLSGYDLIEPSTSAGQYNKNKETINTTPESDPEISSSDLDPEIFDSPKEAKMRKELRRKRALQIKHEKLIRNLRKQNHRLRKRNASLRLVIDSLKKQK